MDVLGWPRLPPRRASLSTIDPRSSQTAPPGPSGSTSGAAGTPPQPAPQGGAPSVRDASSQRTLFVFFVQRRGLPTWHGMLYMCHVTLFQTRWTCTDLLVIILAVSAFFHSCPSVFIDCLGMRHTCRAHFRRRCRRGSGRRRSRF